MASETNQSEEEKPINDLDFEDIRRRLEDQRLFIIRSERRLVPALVNFFYRYAPWKKDLKPGESKASFEALGWSIFSVGGGGGGAGILMVVLTIITINLSRKSNQISEQTNKLLDRQVSIEEASRRAIISAEVSAILDQINHHQLEEKSSKELPSTIVARIAAASQMMYPYSQPDVGEDNGLPKEYSPERTQLLLSLLQLKLSSWGKLLRTSDFSHVVIVNQQFSDVVSKSPYFSANFASSTFEDLAFKYDTLVFANFSKAKMRNVSFYNCHFGGSEFSGSRIENCRVTSSNFRHCNFRAATIKSINIDSLQHSFDGACFDNATVDSAFYTTVLQPIGYPPSRLRMITPTEK